MRKTKTGQTDGFGQTNYPTEFHNCKESRVNNIMVHTNNN